MRFTSFSFLLLLGLVLTTMPATAFSQSVLLVFGDSLTAGYGLEATDSFPAQLEARLMAGGHDVKVINSGVSGDTSSAGLARIDWALTQRPDLVLLELGANDALRGLDPGQTYANLSSILARIRATGATAILAGMKAPRNLGPDYYNKFDQIYTDLAAEHEVFFYPFFLDGVAMSDDLNQPDGIHPNAKGVRLIVENIYPLVLSALKK